MDTFRFRFLIIIRGSMCVCIFVVLLHVLYNDVSLAQKKEMLAQSQPCSVSTSGDIVVKFNYHVSPEMLVVVIFYALVFQPQKARPS